MRVTVSPVRKFDNSAIPAWAKACGQYINSARAVNDAQRRGFDEALLLNSQGQVAEGSGENLFVVKQGAITTNDKDASILMGVTRASVLEIARDLGIEARVAPISVEDVLGADELFFTGTAVEVTPIREVDGTVDRRRHTGTGDAPHPGDVQSGGPGTVAAVPPVALVRPARGTRVIPTKNYTRRAVFTA